MRIEEITSDILLKASDEELKILRQRFLQLWEKYFKSKSQNEIGSLNKISFISRYKTLKKEMVRRDLFTINDISSLDDHILVKSTFRFDVSEFGDIVITSDYCSITGSYVKDPKDANNIDIIIKRAEDTKDEELELKIRKLIKEETGKEAQFIYSTAGAQSSYIPIFDLILKARNETRKIEVKKAGKKEIMAEVQACIKENHIYAKFVGSPKNPYGTHCSFQFKGGIAGYKRAWKVHFSQVRGGALSANASGPIRGTVRRVAMIAAGMKPSCAVVDSEKIGARAGAKSPLSGAYPQKPSDYGLSRWKKPSDEDVDREKALRFTCNDLNIIKRAATAEVKRRIKDRKAEEKKGISKEEKDFFEWLKKLDDTMEKIELWEDDILEEEPSEFEKMSLDQTGLETFYEEDVVINKIMEGDKIDIEKPYPNEHSARLQDPDRYDDWSRTLDGYLYGKRIKVPADVSVIWGHPKGQKPRIWVAQALRFPKDAWTVARTKKWLDDNNISYKLFEPAKKALKFLCECLDCGFVFESEEHCLDVKCPKCGGSLRRKERPGGGKEKRIPMDKNLVSIFKINEDEQIVGGVVYEPMAVDVHEDFASIKDIREACYDFMENVRTFKLFHKGSPLGDKIKILENYLAPIDFEINKQKIKKGSWLLVLRIADKKLWRDIKEEKINAFSMAGRARRREKKK